MKPKVFIARQVPKEVENYIAAHCDYEKWTGEGIMPRQELLQVLSDIEGLLISGERIDHELLNCAPKLKVVSNNSVGYNNFDLSEMKARNILGTNTPSVLDETVADLVLGLMLAAARRLCELDSWVKQGKWREIIREELFGVDVHHKTIGIIGLGRIGEAIARRAKLGFEMKVLYYNRSCNHEAEEKYGAVYCSLERLLQESDFVVLMTPLTPKTANLIGAKEFKLMKKTAIFINASRGETVDEQALIDALNQGKIRGAGLDVYKNEPINQGNPLLKMSNVVTLPHIGSATAKTRFDMAMMAAENLVKGLKGEQPPNLVEELK